MDHGRPTAIGLDETTKPRLHLVGHDVIDPSNLDHGDVIRLVNYAFSSCSDEFLAHLACRLLLDRPESLQRLPQDLNYLMSLVGH